MREHMYPSPLQNSDFTGNYIGDYYVQKLLGIGAFSKVYLASTRNTTEGGAVDVSTYAIKMINKGRLAADERIWSSVKREVAILKASSIYLFALSLFDPLTRELSRLL